MILKWNLNKIDFIKLSYHPKTNVWADVNFPQLRPLPFDPKPIGMISNTKLMNPN